MNKEFDYLSASYISQEQYEYLSSMQSFNEESIASGKEETYIANLLGGKNNPYYWSQVKDPDYSDNEYFKLTNELDVSNLSGNPVYIYYDLQDPVHTFEGIYARDIIIGSGIVKTMEMFKNSAKISLSSKYIAYVDSDIDQLSAYCGVGPNIKIVENDVFGVLAKCETTDITETLRFLAYFTMPAPGPDPEPSSSSSSSSQLDSDTRTVMYTVYAKMSRDVIQGNGIANSGDYVGFGGSSYSVKPLKTTSVLTGSSGYTTGPTGYQRINVSDLIPSVYQIVGNYPGAGAEVYSNGTYQCCLSNDSNSDGVIENVGNMDDFIEGFYVTYEVI